MQVNNISTRRHLLSPTSLKPHHRVEGRRTQTMRHGPHDSRCQSRDRASTGSQLADFARLLRVSTQYTTVDTPGTQGIAQTLRIDASTSVQRSGNVPNSHFN